jgi:hypothetical protein
MQADFDDLRFYSSTGTSLEYWMESKTDSSTAKVWVKIPSIPTTGSTIYMYYGNATVASASSTISYNSLSFQDNFDGNNISNWTKSIWGSYNGDIVADNNRMRLRVYRCHNAIATKSLGNLTGDLYLSFDWSRYNDNTWAEYSDWAISVNGTAVNPQSDYGLGSTYYGNYSGSISNYKATVNGNVEIKFILKQSGPCSAGDHSNSYVWIDNVKVTTAAAANTTNTLGAEESNAPQFAVSGPWTWKCASGGSASTTCTANQTLPACGSANGKSFASAPTENLCAYGTLSAGWLDNAYTKRKLINLNNSSGIALTDYQVKLTVAYDSDMQADFDDLAFTSDNGKTKLSHWVQTKTDSSTATVWVKVPTIPTSGGKIYMYYGNASAASSSNANSTMIFYDGFDTLDASKWSTVGFGSNCGSVSASGSNIYVRGYACCYACTGGIYAVSNPTIDFSQGVTVEFYDQYYNDVSGHYNSAIPWMGGFSIGNAAPSWYSILNGEGMAMIRGEYDVNWLSVRNTTTANYGSLTGKTSYDMKINVTSTNLTVYRNGTAIVSNLPHGWTNMNKKIYLSRLADNTFGYYAIYDRMIVRKNDAWMPSASFDTEQESNQVSLTGSGPWEWYCIGGGTSSPKCTANQIPPACGSANNKSFAAAPTTDLCAYGEPGSLDWLSNSYTKRKPITITNGSGAALSNYQVKLSIAYDADMQADFDDLRFTSSDKKTELSYWIESKTNSSSATVWVKVPSIPTTGTTIYVYYGNSTVATTSNGDNTFVLFDDFNASSINASKWVEVDSSGYVNQTGGTLRINNGPVNWGNTGMYSVADLPRSSLVIEGKYMNNCTAGAYYRDTTMLWMKDTSTSIDYPKFTNAFYAVWYNNSFYWTNYESGTNIAPTGALVCNTQYRLRQIVKPAGGAITQLSSNDGASWTTVRDSANYAGAFKVGITHYDGGVVFIDDLTVRNYASTEPVPTVGAEQSNTTALSGSGPWEWYCLAGTLSSSKCTATSSTTDGQCPVTTNSRTAPTPSCLKGTPSALVTGANAWTWTCTGTGTSTTNVCTATVNKTIDGLAGAADAGSFSSLTATSPNLCSVGSVSGFSGAGPWTWTCTGVNGGNSDTGTANKTANGVCGIVDGSSVISLAATSPNLCSAGSVSGFSGTGPWTWSCTGAYTGTTANCSAKLKVNGDCGTVAGTSVSTLTNTSPNLCRAGTVSNFSVATNSWTWMCVGTNEGLSVACGANKSQTLSVSSMLNPEEFNSEQCVWCEYYRENPEDMNSAIYKGMKESTESGIAVVTPKFQFSYSDLAGKTISQYVFAISTGTNPDTANITTGWLVPEKVSGAVVTIRPGVTINRFGSETQLTKQLKYGKTYNWWVKFKDSAGTISSWSPVKSFTTTNHEWPKVGVLVKDTGNEYIQTCSTMINITNPNIYKTDPCYSVCWSDHANGSAPVLDDSRWKCSVCYDSFGSPTLCQNLPPATDNEGNVVSRFTWDAEDAIFPSLNNQYVGGQNGRYSFNPIVKFSSSLGTTPKKIKLRLRGSDCPLEAAATATTIRPIWVEQ